MLHTVTFLHILPYNVTNTLGTVYSTTLSLLQGVWVPHIKSDGGFIRNRYFFSHIPDLHS